MMTMILGYLQQGFSAVFPFVILLGLLIFVHELGHFLVAKFFGVRVEVFSLGFGKKILSRKVGDTTYCISLIPLGGYVKMFGDEAGANISEENKKFSFLHKPVSQRIGVVLAGPLMNFFFAIFIFFIVALMGEEVRSPVIGDIAADTEAYKSGFRSGDTVLAVDGSSIKTWDDFQEQLNLFSGKNITAKVQRETGGQEETLTSRPVLIENPNLLSLDSQIGDIPGLTGMSRQAIIGVRGGTFAAESGLKSGDKVVSISGHPIKYFRELENIFISMQGQDIQIQAERSSIEKGKPNTKSVSIALKAGRFSSLDTLGIESAELYLYKVIDGSPAEKSGLRANDRILKVNDMTPTKWEDVLETVKGYSGEGPLHFVIEREAEVKQIDITPQMTSQMSGQGAEENRYTVGIMPTIFIAQPQTIKIRADGIRAGLAKSWSKTWEVTGMTVLSFLRLIQNKISPKNIGGVISIGQAASETFKIGIAHFFQMMAIISINLFILNLLPIPVLDGGHLLFYIIEGLRGAPVSMRKMEIAQQIGLVILMSLMVFALFNDFSRLLGSW
jgi:regulator of sigma E protease